MQVSRQIITSILLLLIPGCAVREGAPTDHYRDGLVRSKQLVAAYGQIDSAFVRSYFDYLTKRLVAALRQHAPVAVEYRVALLATREPMAFSAGGGFILCSKGLVLSISSEAELAFIIAHEIAHQQLGHLGCVKARTERPDLELAADRYAVSLMALAGYDPRLALQALRNAYRVGLSWGHNGDYPDLESRLQSVHSIIEKSNWQPPGTVNRRDFVALQRLIVD